MGTVRETMSCNTSWIAASPKAEASTPWRASDMIRASSRTERVMPVTMMLKAVTIQSTAISTMPRWWRLQALGESRMLNDSGQMTGRQIWDRCPERCASPPPVRAMARQPFAPTA